MFAHDHTPSRYAFVKIHRDLFRLREISLCADPHLGRGGKTCVIRHAQPVNRERGPNDPTVERCERRARALGFGAFRVTNIFAWRDTDPRKMRAASEPIGPENDATILEGAGWADSIVAAWGTHGAYLDRGPNVAALLSKEQHVLSHLGLSKAGHPKHPLYISYSQQPILWPNPYGDH